MNAVQLLAEWSPWIGGAMGIAPWIKVWRDARKARRKDRELQAKQQIDLLDLARQAAGEVIEDLREENARIRDQLAEMVRNFEDFRKKHEDFRQMHDVMIADKDAELALLRGENRQLKAALAAYERLLEANHIPHEKPVQPYWLVEAGDYPTELISP